MLTQSSPALILVRLSDVMARPRWALTLRTPGMDRSSRLARVVIRLMAGWEAPALPSQRTTRSVSLKFGSSDSWRRNGMDAIPATSTAQTATKAGSGVRAAHPKAAPYIARSVPESLLSMDQVERLHAR